MRGGCVSGGCQQGRRPCPTPDACWVEVEEDERSLTALILWAAVVATALTLMLAVVWWLTP